MSTSTVETLYYWLYNSVLLGNSQNAKMYLEILRDDYLVDDKQFVELIEDGRFEHLKQLAYAVDNGLVVKNFDYNENSNKAEIASKDENQVETELELVKLIFKNQQNLQNLKSILGVSEEFYIYNVEHPTKFGRVDIVAKDGSTVYLIETKKGEARYSVISQIDKYILDFRLNLAIKMWKHIVGVVIANGFLDQVTKELVKLDVIPIKYNFDDGLIRFRRLYAKTENNNT